MFLLLVFLLVSLIFSFWCSILEASYLKMTPSFVALAEEEGRAYASRLNELVQDTGSAIGAILTLNTVAHTVGAIGVGAQTKNAFGAVAESPIIQIGVPVIMTLLILIASEIIPKNIGAIYWKRLAGFTTRSLDLIISVLKYSGILWMLKQISKLVGHDEGAHLNVTTRTEFAALADVGVAQGVFEESESRVIKNLVRFNQIRAKDIMTPRTVIVAAEEEQTIQAFFDQTLKDTPFSRIPTFAQDKDHITGGVLKDEVLMALINQNGEKPLKGLRREIIVVRESMPIPDLLDKLMESREHLALVVGEYGGTAGLVTIEDVIETLLGLEIMDEVDNIEDMQLLARENWKQRAKKLGLVEKPEQLPDS